MERHPKGLYVLFATEMWERFSFYSMLALFTLYMQDATDGFGWTKPQATSLYANYLMFVYASPLIGGLIADRWLGFRKSVMIGAVFFMIGHLLLSFRSMTAVYAALSCLVIGNGFFKPNVSAMVGSLYPEGSKLKDSAYNIFYMGINIGAFLGPVVMEIVKQKWGYHPAFAVAAGGMVAAILVLWKFQAMTNPHPGAGDRKKSDAPTKEPLTALQAVSEGRRIMALIIIYAIVIVFWMVFHQNGSTLTYWANDNTDWNVSGTISNAINPFWVVTLTIPLVMVWRALGKRGLEPSTPTKMAIGMTLTGLSFFVLYYAATLGEASAPANDPYKYRVSPFWLIGAYGIVTLGELMLSPMGLSLVSKVAPSRLRGIMMGGWFVATAIGNKLTAIGKYWTVWPHSQFFAILGGMALVMAVVIFLLLKPLKRWMPGV